MNKIRNNEFTEAHLILCQAYICVEKHNVYIV